MPVPDEVKEVVSEEETKLREEMKDYHPHFYRTYDHSPLIKKLHTTARRHCFQCGKTLIPKDARGSYWAWRTHYAKHHWSDQYASRSKKRE